MYGQTDNGQYTVLFWEPIDTTELELRIDDYVPIFACVGIKLYGCVSSEGIYYNMCGLHAITNCNELAIVIYSYHIAKCRVHRFI